jgi:peptidoglycan-associated lipoprotein
MPIALRPLALLAAALCCVGAQAQATAPKQGLPCHVQLAFTYDTQGSNLTTTSRFWLQGGAAEVNARVFHGLGFTASGMGLHVGTTTGGVPVNLVIVTFGPSYVYSRPFHSHSVDLFAHGLIGEADGFSGLYPAAGAPLTSSNSLAAQAGGGVDIGLSRHLALRLVQADYVRTQLPNSFSNVQNSLRLGVGIVLR